MGDHFSKKIGNLTIRGEFLVGIDGFKITVDYAGVCLVNNEILDKRNNTYPFSYIPPGASEYAARGLVCYCKDSLMKIPELFAALSAPVGVNIKLYPVGVVPSPPRRPHFDMLDIRTITDIKYMDLFPYMQIPPCPQISDRDIRIRFIAYDKDSGSDPNLKELYNNLVSERQKHDHSAIEKEAVCFIEGETPYDKQFIHGIEDFTTIMRKYMEIYQWLQSHPKIDCTELNKEVLEMTGVGDWDTIKQDISQHEYKDEKERTWETFFSLTITIGYDYRLLDNLIKILIMANIIETLADLYPKENPPVIPNTELQYMANAAIILPSEIFPLPPMNISTS